MDRPSLGAEMPEEGDPDDHSDPVRPESPLTCAECGRRVDETEWHPVVAATDDDGTFRFHAFCSEECREAWRSRKG